jgi:FMN phosphatase YigB (HAD superfamily)
VLPPIRALLVDVGGTLVDDATWIPWEQHLGLRRRALLEAFGQEQPWFDALLAHRFSDSTAERPAHATVGEVAEFLAEHGARSSQREVELICGACSPPLGEVVQLEAHARDALEQVHALGIRMAICSNTRWRGDDHVRRDWQALGFGHLFDTYVSSRSTGYGKPHAAMFERCLDELGVGAGEAAMIGDRPELDIAGAAALSLRTIWKRPLGFEGASDPTPDAELTCLADLPSILAAWNA